MFDAVVSIVSVVLVATTRRPPLTQCFVRYIGLKVSGFLGGLDDTTRYDACRFQAVFVECIKR